MLAYCLLSACGVHVDEQGMNTSSDQSDTTVYRWKMVTTWPPNFPIFQEGPQRFADEVRKMSNGRLDIQVFAGGELVPALQTFDAVSQGTIEMGHGAAYYWAGKVPAAQFFSTVPFGMTIKGLEAWLYQGDGLKLWNDLYRPFNLMAIPMGNTGMQMGGWFNKKIESIDDLKGLKMRIPGLGGNVLDKAGGNPILMSGGEIYTALERGIIDATEWVGPFHDLRLGLNRAVKYYYYPGWHEPGTELELIINTEAWERLPEDLKQIVTASAAATSNWIYTSMEFLNSKSLQEVRQKQNVQILEFPAEVLTELKRLTTITLQEQAAGDAEFSRVYENYQTFRKEYDLWDEVSEQSYQRSLLQ